MNSVDEYKRYIQHLKISDLRELANNSVFNHHTNGMIYLCLKRSERETFKIYYCNNVGNPNGGYLVNPHNHRYEFNSTILKGELHHLRFKESNQHGEFVTKNKYNWQTKQLEELGKTCLYPYRDDHCIENSTYWVSTNEIHTLKLLTPVVIIGLTQYEDTTDNAFLYKKSTDEFKIADSYIPTLHEYYLKLLEVAQHLDINI